jgi:hypothetical protein
LRFGPIFATLEIFSNITMLPLKMHKKRILLDTYNEVVGSTIFEIFSIKMESVY